MGEHCSWIRLSINEYFNLLPIDYCWHEFIHGLTVMGQRSKWEEEERKKKVLGGKSKADVENKCSHGKRVPFLKNKSKDF